MLYVNEDAFDFLSKLKDNSVDLILTDPPYIISRKTGFEKCIRGEKRFKVSMDFACDKVFTIEDMKKSCREFYRVLKKSGTCIIFFDLWKIGILKEMLELEGFSKVRFLEWIKNNPVPLNARATYLSNSREVAISCIKGAKAKFNSYYDSGIYRAPIVHGKQRFHPNQKPLKLGYELVLKHSNQGDVVLDCFAGSATFLIAADQADRIAIGCEKDKDIYDRSMLRIEQDLLRR